MKEKYIRILCFIIYFIILVANIILIIIYVIHSKFEFHSFSLFENIHNYIIFHHLNEDDYNFSKVFIGYNGDYMGDRYKVKVYEFLNTVYGIISILGYIFSSISIICKNINCFLILSTIIFFIALIISIIDIYYAYGIKLTEKDLSDFGPLNQRIREAYDAFLEERYYMKISSIFLMTNSLFMLIAPFILMNCLKKLPEEEVHVTLLNPNGSNDLIPNSNNEDVLTQNTNEQNDSIQKTVEQNNRMPNGQQNLNDENKEQDVQEESNDNLAINDI